MRPIVHTLLFCLFTQIIHAQNPWPDSLLITPEKTDFQKTSTWKEVMTFLAAIKNQSPEMTMLSMGTSLEGRQIPLVVLANPPVRSAEEAKRSGKPVIYIQGNIHAGEVEGKESLMILMRDILLGDKHYLLDSQIILLAPIYNTDANDRMAKGLRPSQEDSPLETGERESSEGYDLNRDGVKLEAIETRALLSSVILPWDPQVFVDLHTTNGTWHAFPLTWAPSYLSSGDPFLFRYSYYKMLPEITRNVREHHDLNLGVYGDYYLSEGWPPKHFYSFSHQPRYLVNYMGFRNRIGILSEAFAHNRFYERINSTYAFVSEILHYSNTHAGEIQSVNRQADEAAINQVVQQSGKLKKGVRFRMVPLDTLNHFITYDYLKGTGPDRKPALFRTGKIVAFDSVVYYAAFTPILESTLPRGYLIPASETGVIRKLELHGIKVTKLSKSRTFRGERFRIDSLTHEPYEFQKHRASLLHGQFITETRTFRKGDYLVDMAQPLAHLIFYLLEPQSDDGLAHWNFFDPSINKELSKQQTTFYPVFKYYAP